MLSLGTQISELNFTLHVYCLFILNGYQTKTWHLTFLITLKITFGATKAKAPVKELLFFLLYNWSFGVCYIH